MSTKPMRADARRNRERILAAAERVFARSGASASTEEVAAAAGVAIGTVFRHFPTKRDLLAAIMKDLLARLTAELEALAAGDRDDALFDAVTLVVEQAATKKAVVDLLAAGGEEVGAAAPVRAFGTAIGTLLERAQRSGFVRAEVRSDEILALLTATTQGALHGDWPPDLRRRTLSLIFTGLRPAASGPRSPE